MRTFIYRLAFSVLVVLGVVVISAEKIHAQSAQPLNRVLRVDGSIDVSKGFTGTLDPRGYKMTLTPTGAPRFVTATVADDQWSGMFGSPGVSNGGGNAPLNAIAVSGNDIYLGGYFDIAGNISTRHIVKYNIISNTWSTLGTGVNDQVYAITINGTDIYVGGSFTEAGGVTANRIAKWNGSVWSAMNTGMNGDVRSIVVTGSGVLYAGGLFTTAGDSSAKGVARWDGTFWHPMGAGIEFGSVLTMAYRSSTSELIVGGTFLTGGGVSGADRIAKWNGTTWFTMGNAFSSYNIDYPFGVYTIAIGSTGYVVIGGNFGKAGGVTVNNLAYYDDGSNAWKPFTDTSTQVGTNYPVYSTYIAAGGDVYIGGDFDRAGGITARQVARYSGGVWNAYIPSNGLGLLGYPGRPIALSLVGSTLYIGGPITRFAGRPIYSVARWSGTNWVPIHYNGLGLEPYSGVYAMASTPGNVYVGGLFVTAGEDSAYELAKWNGSTWSSYGPMLGGYPESVEAVAVSGANIYVGTSYTKIGSITANYIAKWNGSVWSAMGSGMNGYVRALAVDADTVYAAGDFTTAGGNTVNNIAKWNGSSWSALGTGVSGAVQAILLKGKNLYVGGSFTSASGVNALNIAKWDGSTWSALGAGLGPNGNSVASLAFAGPHLYAGGSFSQSASTTLKGIARWDGTKWNSVGSGVKNANLSTVYVNGLATIGTDVYAAGSFDTAGTVFAGNVARWDGSTWNALGSGISSHGGGQVNVSKVAIDANKVYFGGYFGLAGGKPSLGFAQWTENTVAPSAPLLTNPPQGAQNQSVNQTLRWASAGVGCVYQVVVSTDVLFSSTIVNDTAVYLTSYDVSSLPASSSLVWKVRAKNLWGTGPYSTVGGFTTTIAPPAAPVPVSPANGSVNQSNRTTFTWNASPGAISYRIQTSTDSLFSSIYLEDSTVTGTSKELQVNTNTKYYWHVYAKNAGGVGVYSPTWSYTTSSTAAPGTPTLSSPADNATNQSRTLTLSWGSVSSTTAYRLQVSTDSLFTSTFFNDTSATTSKQAAGMAASTKYFWRVNASNAGGAGFWSVVRRFTTTAATGVEEAQGLPKEYALHQNFPNPFNPTTVVSFQLPVDSYVRLRIFDILGNEIAALVDQRQPAGSYQVHWTASGISSGMYFLRMEAGSFVDVKKLVLMK
ncbi:MAG: T9SS type A sorting domain-containing protein [Bacteroidota bacterium]